MFPGPRKSKPGVTPKSEEQLSLEEVTDDICSNVSDLQKEYIADLKRMLATIPLQQFNFNVIVKKRAPLFFQLMEAAEDSEPLSKVLGEFFLRLPIAKLNWNFEVRGANKSVCSPLLLLMRSAVMGKEWAQKMVSEVFRVFPMTELCLNTTESDGTYKDHSVFGILLYCAYDRKMWACTAFKLVIKNLEIESDLNVEEMAALGLLMYSLFSDTAWSLDGMKTVSQSELSRYYGWVGIIANDSAIKLIAMELLTKLAVLGHPRFLHKALCLQDENLLDFNETQNSVIDILSSCPQTRGLACQVMLVSFCRDQNVVVKNKAFVEDVSSIIGKTTQQHCKMHSAEEPKKQQDLLAKALCKTLSTYLLHMTETERYCLLMDFAAVFLQKREALKPKPINYDELIASFGYNVSISNSQPALLISLERYNSRENDEHATPLLPPTIERPPKP